MRSHRRNRLLLLAAAWVGLAAAASAQPGYRGPIIGPPSIPRPPSMFDTPGAFGVKSWYCPKCNREVWRGPTPPAFTTCCSERYMNGQSTALGPSITLTNAPAAAATPIAAAGAAPVVSVVHVVLGLAAVLCALLIAFGVGVLVVNGRTSATSG